MESYPKIILVMKAPISLRFKKFVRQNHPDAFAPVRGVR